MQLSGKIDVPLPPGGAFLLFTPSGERNWVDDWAPLFPIAPRDETEPGTVFETHHGGAHTIWVVTNCEPNVMIEYARITPGDRAGLVRVQCAPAKDNATSVTVSYELTALMPESNDALDEFADNYEDFLEDWRRSIQHAIDAG